MKLVSNVALTLGAAVVVPMVYFGLTPLAIDGVVVTPRPSCDNKSGRETHSSSRWENGTLVVNISEAQNCGLSQQSVAVQRIGSSLFVRTKYDGVPAACICRQNFSLAVPGVPEQSYEIAVYNVP